MPVLPERDVMSSISGGSELVIKREGESPGRGLVESDIVTS